MEGEIQRQVLDEDPAWEIVQRLVDACHPLQIYLFGSNARGTAGPDSDYDLLVVMRDDAPPELKSSKLAYESLWGIGVGKPTDVLVCPESWFHSRATVITSLPATVLREGKLLYAE